MACSGCKKKSGKKTDINKTMNIVGKGVVWFVIIWSLLGVYGIISLIKNIF